MVYSEDNLVGYKGCEGCEGWNEEDNVEEMERVGLNLELVLLAHVEKKEMVALTPVL